MNSCQLPLKFGACLIKNHYYPCANCDDYCDRKDLGASALASGDDILAPTRIPRE